MTEKIYDAIVIGGGPSGITASVYLSRKKFEVLMIYDKLGGRTVQSPGEPNYVGFTLIEGRDFVKKLEEQSKENKIDLKEEKVIEVKKEGDRFVIKTDEKEYHSKSVIIASGSSPRKLNIKGEKEYAGKGVSYCATCDAPLFSGKDVAVIGSANFAIKEALLLEKYAKNIYVITEDEKLCADKYLIEKAKRMSNAEILCSHKVLEIKGEKFVNGIVIDSDGERKNLRVKGVFIRLGYIPNSFFAEVEKNDDEEIIIDDKNETSVKGIFASGDVTNTHVKQIIVAAGEGAKAAIAAAEYLELLKEKK